MFEYLRTDNSPLDISYSASSYATNVYFEVYDLDTQEFIQGGRGVEGASSVFTITLNTDSTSYDRNLTIEYITTSGSGAYNEIQTVSLVRPYATPSRIRSLADVSDSVTDSTIQKLERRARLNINSYVGFDFYKKKKTFTYYGNNTDVISLSENIFRIDAVYEDDILIYERGGTDNELDFPLEIGPSSNRIKILNTDEESKEILESPKFSVFHYDGIFKKDHSYKIDGIWGWNYIPSEIEEATALLVNDYLCNDFNIRNKNIAELSNDSYNIKYGSDAATGTGNLTVDNLISHYRQPRYMVI